MLSLLLVVFQSGLAYAGQGCAMPASLIEPFIAEVAPKLNRLNVCVRPKVFTDGPARGQSEIIEKASAALFQTTHLAKPASEQVEGLRQALRSRKSFGAPHTVSESNSFLVKNSQGSAILVTAKHVVAPKESGSHFYVSKSAVPVFVFNKTLDDVRPNPDLIAVPTENMMADASNDIAFFRSEKFGSHVGAAVSLRNYAAEPLALGEAATLAGFQNGKVRTFSCQFRGFGSDSFAKGIVEQFFRCDNADTLLGSISGGIILDNAGRALGVFNGFNQLRSNEKANFIRATPIFEGVDGLLSAIPRGAGLRAVCVPCFSLADAEAFTDIHAGRQHKRSQCLVHFGEDSQKPVFEVSN